MHYGCFTCHSTLRTAAKIWSCSGSPLVHLATLSSFYKPIITNDYGIASNYNNKRHDLFWRRVSIPQVISPGGGTIDYTLKHNIFLLNTASLNPPMGFIQEGGRGGIMHVSVCTRMGVPHISRVDYWRREVKRSTDGPLTLIELSKTWTPSCASKRVGTFTMTGCEEMVALPPGGLSCGTNIILSVACYSFH
ncbi:unnamed protein product [Boreogadus saida]